MGDRQVADGGWMGYLKVTLAHALILQKDD
jgi:hypothetical protein